MSRIFEKPVSTSNLYTPDFESLCQIFGNSFDDDGQFVTGSLVSELESKLCEYHQSKYCVTFSTGFWALVASIRIKSLPEKNEVIIPSLTYRRLADVVFWADKTPVFVDIDPESLAICPDSIEQAITDETALIVGVHPIVNCCDVKKILSVANSKNIPVIFDAVESVHETIDSKRIGSFGVGEVFSFHASKFINGLEGGYVCTDDVSFKTQLECFRDNREFGNTSYKPPIPLSLNGVMNDGHAAFAIAGLAEISSNVEHNKAIYETYLNQLANVDGIRILRFDESEQTSFKNVVAEITNKFPVNRNRLVELLAAEGILARSYYSPSLHTKTYAYRVKSTKMNVTPVAEQSYINLPCGGKVSPQNVETICQFIESIGGSQQGPPMQ